MMLKGKVALVTGAGRGIGQCIAISLAQHGAKMILSDISLDALKDTEAKIKALGTTECFLTQANVAIADEVNDMVKKALDTYGNVDILVNNAGITRDGLLAMMPEKDWDDVLSINLRSVFLVTKACTRAMVKQRSGAIVNIASVVGVTGNAGQANYSASKAGVIGFTKSVAKELAKRNIRANAVAPGFIRTAMTDKLSEEQKKKITEYIPLGRMGEAQEIADAVVFLASDASRYITGQVLVVDGGMVM
jgi:3-oxoacyl-[acyl-carrier protein] reductase